MNAPRTLPRRDAAAELEALGRGVCLLETEPLDLRVLVAVHRLLLPPAHPYRGGLRDRSAVIRLGGRVHWRAPPPDVARRQTEGVLAWMQCEGLGPELSGEAMARLTAAHPFLDGNGRVALTVVTWLLERGGFSLCGNPIRYCLARKPDLYRALAVNDRAPPAEEWASFFTELVDACFEFKGGYA